MYKILLDDEFYEDFVSNKDYLEKLVDFITGHSDIEFVFFHPFKNNKTYHSSYWQMHIEKKLLGKRLYKKEDLANVTEMEDRDFDELSFSGLFIGKILYLKSITQNLQLVIPLCKKKHNKNKKASKEFVYYINHYAKELESNMLNWIGLDIIHIPYPTQKCIFPAANICFGFEDLREYALKCDCSSKISYFERIGMEVAGRNQYRYDGMLTGINKQKARRDRKGGKPKRKIFRSKGGTELYLSVDFENGGFEVFGKNAEYLGQYRFDGRFEKLSDLRNHRLYLS